MTDNRKNGDLNGELFARWELALCVIFRDTAILDKIKAMRKRGMTNREIFRLINAVLRERGRRL